MADEQPILSRKALAILRTGGAAGIPGNRNLAAKVAALDKEMPDIVRRVAKGATKRAATQAQALYTEAFDRQQYFRPDGLRYRLGRNTPKYNKWKARLGLTPVKRGHFSGRLSRAIDDMVKVSHTGFGIKLELRAAAARSGASEYLDYYEEQKAPGLGDPRSIPRIVFKDWERYMRREVRREAGAFLKSVAGSKLIPKILSDRQVGMWIGKVRVELRAG